MTEEELENRRHEYEEKRRQANSKKELYQEIQSLLKDSNVKRYLELTKFFQKNPSSDEEIKKTSSDDEILTIVLRRHGRYYLTKSDTINLYIYMGSYTKNQAQQARDYYKYKNIETEKEVDVTFGPDIFGIRNILIEPSGENPYDEFLKIQDEYYTELVNSSQEQAIQKIKSKYSKN